MNKIDFNLKGKSGIYMFFNMISGKRYVGSSVNINNNLHYSDIYIPVNEYTAVPIEESSEESVDNIGED